MKRYCYPVCYLIFSLLSIVSAPALHAQIAGDSVLIDQPAANDLYLAGKNIDVIATVDGDVVGAGRRVNITGQVNGDVIAAGETVSIQANILDDLRVAGKTVDLSGDVSGHMVAAGQSVTIGPESGIGGWAWLAGETIIITGDINGELKAAGRSIFIDGEIGGDVEIMGEDLRVGPRAIIRGNLTWHGPDELDLSDSARISGQVTEGEFFEEREDEHDEESILGPFIFTFLTVAAGSIILFLLLPRFSKDTSALVLDKPWHCLGLGLAVLLVTPFVGLVLLVMIITYLPGLALLFAYLAYLIAGFLFGVISIGYFGLLLTKKAEEATRLTWVLAILPTAIAASGLWAIPFLGGLLFMLVWITGVGCASLGLLRQFQKN